MASIMRCGSRLFARRVQLRHYSASANQPSLQESRLPRIANPSLWASLVPRAFRRPRTLEEAEQRHKTGAAGQAEKRVGISFLILGLIVGSNAIQLIALRRERVNLTRQSDARLGLLREVMERVKAGEDVDIKRALGTGNKQDEAEWEALIDELAAEGKLFKDKRPKTTSRVEKSRSASAPRIEEKEEKKNDIQNSESTTTAKPKFFM